MRAVLLTLFMAVRDLAIAIRPVVRHPPTCCSTRWASRAEARTFCRSRMIRNGTESWSPAGFRHRAAGRRVLQRLAFAEPKRSELMLIDSHCHLNYKGLVEDQQAVLARARAAGIGGFLNISTRQCEWDAVVGLAEREADVWASVGIHPHEADAHADLGAAALIAAASHPRVIAIGETGLDYYYEHSERATQQTLFRTHIQVARVTGLPLIVHTRDAETDTEQILAEEMGKGVFTGLIHCFTASAGFRPRHARSRPVDLAFRESLRSRTPATCSRLLPKYPKSGCWSKPTRRSLRRCRIAAKSASRPLPPIRRASWLNCAAFRPKCWPRRRPGISSACSPKPGRNR